MVDKIHSTLEQPPEIIGQYASDHFIYGDEVTVTSEEGVGTRGHGNVAFHHDETIFDVTDGDARSRMRDTTVEDDLMQLEGVGVIPDKLAVDGLHRLSRKQRQIDKTNNAAADAWLKANKLKWDD